MNEFLSVCILTISPFIGLTSQESIIEGRLGIGTSPLTTLHIGNSSSNSKLLFENAGDLQWKNSTGNIKNILSFHVDNNLYLDTEFDFVFKTSEGERVRFFENGDIKVNSGTIEIYNLGISDNDKGIKLSENNIPAFGLIYDGEESGSANRIHFREYLDGQTSDIMTLKGNGRVGIGETDPINELEINGVSNGGVAGFKRADLGGNKSHILHGDKGDWYIRPSLNDGKIVIADNGGYVGIGTGNPINNLEIRGDSGEGVLGLKRSDHNGSRSHALYGNKGDWYIRPSLNDGKIIIADHGGNVGIGTNDPQSKLEVSGKINISDDGITPNEGDIRFNSSSDDFEGFDGTEWYSLTNNKKKTYTLNIGVGEIMIDKNDQSDFDISLLNGYTTFTSFFSSDGHMFCPLTLPVGSRITEVTYNYSDTSPTVDMSFELNRYNQSSSGNDSYFGFSSSNISTNGFETEVIPGNHVIADNYYYAFIFTLRWTSGDYDQHKIQGVKVKYELP